MADMNGRNTRGSSAGIPDIFGTKKQAGAPKAQSTPPTGRQNSYQGNYESFFEAYSSAPAAAAGAQAAPAPKKKLKLRKGRLLIVAAVPVLLTVLIVVLACSGNRDLKSEIKSFVMTETSFKSGSIKVCSESKPTKEKMKELFGDEIKVKDICTVTGKYGKFAGEGTAPAEPAKGEYFLIVAVSYKKDGEKGYDIKMIGSYPDEDALKAAVAECEKNVDSALAAAGQPAA